MPSYCFFRHCPNRDIDKKFSFHRFPANPILRQQWLLNTREDEKYFTRDSRLCSAHFENICFQIVNNKRTLKNGACPTIFIPPLTKIKPKVPCQTRIIHKTSSTGKTIGQNNTPSTSSDSTTITNYPKFEEIYIKEEPREETSQDCEEYKNVSQSVKKECITENNIRKTVNINFNSFCCKVCNKSFTHESNLKEHEKIHETIKQFRCYKCEKLFKRRSHLDSHLKIHAGIKDFSCPTCNKSFSQSNNLNRHMNIHNEIQECTICNTQFKQYNTLKVHMKSHSNNREYQCSV